MKIEALQQTLGKALGEMGMSIEILLPSNQSLILGKGKRTATITIHNNRAARNLLLLNENGIIESFLRGDLDIEGSLMDVLKCRRYLKSGHGLSWLARFALPAFLGQVFTNRVAIRKHYELDPAFYLSFLDATYPAYTQSIYLQPDDTLAIATERKFTFAAEACKMDENSHILEVGPGWGAFIKYLIPKGVRITAITNSPQSKAYLEDKYPSQKLQVIEEDFLSYKPTEKFSAVSIMGVIEHLPQYDRVCQRIREVLEPGGYAYLDASASKVKYEMSKFIYKHIFPYNHSFLHLEGFLTAAKVEGLVLVSLHDDTLSYQYTIETWAKNLEAHRTELVSRFGEYDFRRFRLYLWGSALAMEEGTLQCHRIVLRAPGGDG
ncbi:MAG: class I SAM-dependent methyltransferase [Bacteroidetes bacterium]|nr:class I SAM-dependent methyltransferase [Bacteroidota bacterium]